MQPPSFLSADKLLKEHRVESFRLELKTAWDERTKGAILKTVCAFANDLHNQNGGYIVLGVAEEGGKAVLPPVGLPAESLELVQKEILGHISRWVTPDYVAGIFADRVDGRDVLVIRCQTGPNRPYAVPERLEKGTAGSPYVRVGAETKLAREELLRQLNEVSQRVPFDAQPCYALTARDINPDLLNSYLREAGLSVDDDTSVEQRLRDENLLQRVNGHEAPLNAAVLFFTSEPERRYRGAQIEIVQENDDGDKLFEKTLRGRLPFLLSQALEILKSLNTTRVQKHDDRAEADRDAAWPIAAVEEAVVNAVHHRGYDPAFPEPIKIELYPDRMTITSYPGPPPGVTLKALETGDLPQVVARNRRIGELLKIAKLAEARRKGIKKIRRAMEQNGNPPPQFRFDEETRTYFEVVLPIHPAHRPQSHRRALPLRVGRPAPASELVGRDKLIAQINAELEHNSVCLLGPKGRGVSSVLNGLEVPVAGERREKIDLHKITEDKLSLRFKGLLEELIPEDGLVILLDHLPVLQQAQIGAVLRQITSALIQHERLRIVVALGSPDDISDKEATASDWWTHLRPIVVPPLNADDAQTLAARLLEGVGASHVDELALAIMTSSAGLPNLVHRLVNAIRVDPDLNNTNGIPDVLLRLVASRGDPTTLQARSQMLEPLLESSWHGAQNLIVHREALDTLSRYPEGMTWAELMTSLLEEGRTTVGVHTALSELIEQGWITERERQLNFEHPILSEEWRKLRGFDAQSPANQQPNPRGGRRSHHGAPTRPYSDDDIPF
ncbi:putative DNA binding domain-containing protein [Myxococcota bacterium]|nr:putative DNA binding domain-containing protein [Myxococcota bacterium]